MYDHLNHIHQQLQQREISIELQQFKHVQTSDKEGYYEVPAYNESLILTNAHVLPVGTRIISDNNSLEIGPKQSTLEAIEEFSGLVSIELPENPSHYPVLEFIQIVRQ